MAGRSRLVGAFYQLLFVAFLLFASQMTGMVRAEEADRPLGSAELAQLVAPIALYPDTLLTQVLMASTYPLEVVAAARWSRQNPNVKGPALEVAMQGQNWDPSVKALTALPQVLQMMSDQLDWTQRLGDVFLAQQEELFDAVQDLRARAEAAGHLKSTEEQRVTRVQRPASVTVVPGTPAPPANVIVIESARPETYFVPIYNPAVVFGSWPFPTYQPFFWHPPGWVAGNAFAFATGVAVGGAIWGNVNWWNRNVNINVNRYNSFNRTRVVNNNWSHNPRHRRGVPYRNADVSRRFDPNRPGARQKAADRVAQGKGGGGMQGGPGYGMGGMAGAGGMKGGPGYGMGGMAGTGGMKGGPGYGMGGMAGTGGMKGGPGYGMGGMAGTGGMKGGPGYGMGGMAGTGGMKGGPGYGMGGMAGTGGMKGGPGYGMGGMAGVGGMKGGPGYGMGGVPGGGMGGVPGGGMGGVPGGGMGGMPGGGMGGMRRRYGRHARRRHGRRRHGRRRHGRRRHGRRRHGRRRYGRRRYAAVTFRV